MAQRKDRSTPTRRMRGFEPAAALLAARVRRAAEGRGFAVSRLITHWPEIAGDDLAAATRPVRVSHAKGGFGATLTLLVRGALGPMIEMRLPDLRDRVNACYGYNAIQRIVLTQTAASGFAEGQAVFTHAASQKRAPQPADPARVAGARNVAQKFDDPELAAAMEQLALNVAGKLGRPNRKETQ